MKKFVSGVIVGALLFAGVSVFADSVGLIGQKVTGTFSVEKDGKKIADAAIINGSAYAPVRAVSNATGAELKVEGRKIIMGEANATDAEQLSVKKSTLRAVISSAQSNIDIANKNDIERLEKRLIELKANDTGSPESKLTIKSVENSLAESRAYIAEQQAKIDEAKKQLAELEK